MKTLPFFEHDRVAVGGLDAVARNPDVVASGFDL
jgi:hypothetical protein